MKGEYKTYKQARLSIFQYAQQVDNSISPRKHTNVVAKVWPIEPLELHGQYYSHPNLWR